MRRPNLHANFAVSEDELLQFQSQIGYVFNDKSLLRHALTHKSASDGKAGFANNERLEWLGDRVLGLCVAQNLFDGHKTFDEGNLTKTFNNIVNGDNCANAAHMIGLDKLVITSKSIAAGSLASESVVSDAFEALLGAVYIDGGLDGCSTLIKIAIEASKHKSTKRNVKSELQEWAQKQGFDAPIYKVIERTGPDHEPKFHVCVSANQKTYCAWGNSKQLAEQAAALKFIDLEIKNDN